MISFIKTHLKKIIIVISALLCALFILLVGLTVYFSSPKVIVKNVVAYTAKDFASRREIAPLAEIFSRGSISVNYSDEEEYLDISGKIYFSHDAQMIEELTFSQAGNAITTNAYLSGDYFYLQSDDLLGGKPYGAVRGKLLDSFRDSYFYTDFVAENANYVEILESAMESYDNGKAEQFEEEFNKLANKYIREFIKLCEKYADYEKEIKTVETGGKSIKARVVTLTVDAKAAKTIATDLYDLIKSDESISELIENYSGIIANAFYSLGHTDLTLYNITEKYNEALKSFGEAIENIDYEAPLVVEFATSRFSAKLYNVKCLCEEDVVFELDFGKSGVKKTKRIAMSSCGESIAVYEISSTGKKEYSSNLHIEKEEVFSLNINKRSKSYTAKIGNDVLEISGKYRKFGDTVTLTVETLQSSKKKDFSVFEIKLDRKDRIKAEYSKKDVNQLLSLKKADIETLVYEFENIVKMFSPLDGKYAFSYSSKSISYKFSGQNVTLTVSAIGHPYYEFKGTYRINKDKIIFSFDDPNAAEYNGEFYFNKGSDYEGEYITIGSERFFKK